MSELLPDERCHEDLLREARERLAERLGGQWAVASQLAAPSAIETPANESMVSQRQLAAEEEHNHQRLIELGMLAAGTTRKQVPYFVR